jgi:CRP-like cAMP-binding protein
MGSKLTLLAQKIRFLQFGTIRQKIAGYLLDEMRKQRSSSLKIPYTKEALSEIFGVTRPSFSRVFSELCHEKIIRQKGKTVTVLNAAKLKAIMAETD